MRQALHIFKKDVRQLWFEIAIALIVTAAFAFIGARRGFWLDDPGANRSVAWSMVQLMLPLAWWILIARVVYGEILPGDRQFWITRPYRWTSLLGAKLLFIGVFVNLPLLAADVIILARMDSCLEKKYKAWCGSRSCVRWSSCCRWRRYARSPGISCNCCRWDSCCWWACWYGTSLYQGFPPSAAGGVLDWVTLYYVFLVAALRRSRF